MIVDIRIPAGPDPIGEWAGECARWLCLCEAWLQLYGETLAVPKSAAAPDPVARVIALRIDAGLPSVVVDMAADPWPESATALVTWAAVRAHALTHRDARRALRAALAAGDCVEAARLCAAMGVSDE